jgi:hypothetical protein
VSISYNLGDCDPDVPLDVLRSVHGELDKGLGVELTPLLRIIGECMVAAVVDYCET